VCCCCCCCCCAHLGLDVLLLRGMDHIGNVVIHHCSGSDSSSSSSSSRYTQAEQAARHQTDRRSIAADSHCWWQAIRLKLGRNSGKRIYMAGTAADAAAVAATGSICPAHMCQLHTGPAADDSMAKPTDSYVMCLRKSSTRMNTERWT